MIKTAMKYCRYGILPLYVLSIGQEQLSFGLLGGFTHEAWETGGDQAYRKGVKNATDILQAAVKAIFPVILTSPCSVLLLIFWQ